MRSSLTPGRPIRVGLTGACILLILSACNLLSEVHTFRYRMTVEVETPEGLRSGSSVREVTLRVPAYWEPPGGRVTRRVRGEAVAIDLPGGKTLFALLDPPSNYAAQLPTDIFRGRLDMIDPPLSGGGYRLDYAKRVAHLRNTKPSADVSRDRLPTFVHFLDVSDPTTVERLNPDDLAIHLGKEVRLRRVSISITDAPVNDTIRQRLPWLGTLDRGSLLELNPAARAGRAEVSDIYQTSLSNPPRSGS